MAEIEARQKIADARAAILKEAFEQANINIVGGDGQFFERFINAVSVGKSIDGFVENSQNVQQDVWWLPGERREPAEGHHGHPRGHEPVGEGPAELSVSAFLGKMMMGADGQTKAKLQSLVDKAKELGVDEPN